MKFVTLLKHSVKYLLYRVFESIGDTNLVVFKSSWIDEAISFSKSSMLSTKGIEKFILLPEDLEEGNKVLSFKYKSSSNVLKVCKDLKLSRQNKAKS